MPPSLTVAVAGAGAPLMAVEVAVPVPLLNPIVRAVGRGGHTNLPDAAISIPVE